MATGPAHLRPRDCLTGVELHRVAALIRHGILPQGPLSAIRQALENIKWNMPQAHLMVNKHGQGLDLTVGSPTMLKHFIADQIILSQHEETNSMMISKGRLRVGQDLSWPLLRTFLTKKALASSHKAALLGSLYGTFSVACLALGSRVGLAAHLWNL